MSLLQIVCLTLYAAGMALGQVLFKLAAESIRGPHELTAASLLDQILKASLNPFFILAILLYLSLSAFWIWILSFTPLSKAYPFTALALVFTLLIGVFFFRETLSRNHLAGFALLLGSIVLIAKG